MLKMSSSMCHLSSGIRSVRVPFDAKEPVSLDDVERCIPVRLRAQRGAGRQGAPSHCKASPARGRDDGAGRGLAALCASGFNAVDGGRRFEGHRIALISERDRAVRGREALGALAGIVASGADCLMRYSLTSLCPVLGGAGAALVIAREPRTSGCSESESSRAPSRCHRPCPGRRVSAARSPASAPAPAARRRAGVSGMPHHRHVMGSGSSNSSPLSRASRGARKPFSLMSYAFPFPFG